MAALINKLKEPVSKLLKKGVEIFKSLAEDMKNAVQLKEYADQMAHITQVLKAVNEHLDDKEKKVGDLLNEAYKLSTKAMDDASNVVSVIKSQTSALVAILSPSVPGTDKQKMLTACKCYSKFAEKIESKVSDAEKSLRDASNKLQEAQNDIGGIVDTLETVHKDVIEEMKVKKAAQRAKAYGGAAAGAAGGLIGLIVSYSIAAGVTEGSSIPKIESAFAEQRQAVSDNIESFKQMQTKAKTLQQNIAAKKQELIDIRGQLSTLGSLTGNDEVLKDTFETMLPVIRDTGKTLVDACDRFLKNPN
jgi:DNA repair exonuclease SbcCD ATPase subunit